MIKKTVNMKRIYIKPDMQVVELKTRNHLLVGSERPVSVHRGYYIEEEMEDL